MDIAIKESFYKIQNEIYKDFEYKTSRIEEIGIIPNKRILEGESAYLIGINHEINITEKVSEISTNISSIAEGVVQYDEKNIHTTISPYLLEPIVKESDDETIKTLKDIVNKVINSSKWDISMTFKKVLMNQDSIIALGYPTDSFIELSHEINKLAATEGIELRMPKMAHITVARFTEVLGTDTLSHIKTFIEKSNSEVLGVSKIKNMFVGFFKTDINGFYLEKKERIYL